MEKFQLSKNGERGGQYCSICAERWTAKIQNFMHQIFLNFTKYESIPTNSIHLILLS